MLERLGLAFESWARKNMPDPFVLVLLLTILTGALAIVLHHDLLSIVALPTAWLGGFWELLKFSMQMVLIVVTGEAIVATKPVRMFFAWVSERPRSANQAVWLLTTVSLGMGWLHWGFGLIGAALLARQMARTLGRKGIPIDYPLLGAAAYMSMLLWHAGVTATAPLLINTPGHFLEKTIGIVPLSQTVFLPSNLAACAVLFLLVPWVMVKMHGKTPRPAANYLNLDDDGGLAAREQAEAARPPESFTFAEKLDRSWVIGRFVGWLGLVALAIDFLYGSSDAGLTHNTVNFILLSVGLFIHGSPVSYARAVANSVRGTSGIILQYPFYGGIMGMMSGSGLGYFIASKFVALSSAGTLPFFAYLASTLTKLFVPSGGGEWAVEGPVMLEAAKNLGAAYGKTTLGIAYGNMVGNMFQPFWAIPLLSILGIGARDIMGYCLVVFLFAFPILGAALLLAR